MLKATSKLFPSCTIRGRYITYDTANSFLTNLSIAPEVNKWLCAFCGVDIKEHQWASSSLKGSDGAITPRWQPSFCTLPRLLDRVAQDFFPEKRVLLDVEQSHWTPTEWSDHPLLIFREVDEAGYLVSTTGLNLQQRDPDDGGFPSFENAFPSLMKNKIAPFTYSAPAMDIDEQLETLKHYLDVCDCKTTKYVEFEDQIHHECHKDVDLPIPAARVLDLADATAGTIRVVNAAGLTDKYITLSWCWGHPRTHPLKTTRATLEDRMSGIAMSELPRTFLDAIRVCQYLNVRYLWIDCKCQLFGSKIF
jgi:hypothetical protein